MTMLDDDFPLLTRPQAIEFIRSECGVPVATSTLEKKALRGSGPPVKRFYGRRALYSKADLREWALGLTSEKPEPLDAA
jgi:hypothetical protein